MSSGVLRLEQVTVSVLAWWRNTFPLRVATVWPGTVLDTAGVTEWVEGWSGLPQRAGGPERVELSLTVHCFTKPGMDVGRVQELADAARETLSQQTIAVRDFAESGGPVVGYVSVFEAEVRDLTRNHAGSLQKGMRHAVVTCRGVAQGV